MNTRFSSNVTKSWKFDIDPSTKHGCACCCARCRGAGWKERSPVGLPRFTCRVTGQTRPTAVPRAAMPTSPAGTETGMQHCVTLRIVQRIVQRMSPGWRSFSPNVFLLTPRILLLVLLLASNQANKDDVSEWSRDTPQAVPASNTRLLC